MTSKIKKIKAVIFDQDGVLLDSEVVNIEAVARAFAAFGHHLSTEDKLFVAGGNPRDYLPYLFQKLGISPRVQAEISKKRASIYYQLWEERARLMPHARKVVNRLKSQNFILALVSNSSKKMVTRFITKFNFLDIFILILTGEDVKKHKPDSEVYLLAKDRLGLEDKEILVVEDTSTGVTAAKEAGLFCVAIPGEFTKNQDFSQADLIISSLIELLDIL